MLGTLIGIGLALGYLSAVFGSTQENTNLFSGSLLAGLATIGLLSVIGLTLFPRTIGIAFTFPIIVSPVAIIGGFVKHGLSSGLTMLIFAIALWGSSQLIARVRPEAT
jgi:hypothetical protein